MHLLRFSYRKRTDIKVKMYKPKKGGSIESIWFGGGDKESDCKTVWRYLGPCLTSCKVSAGQGASAFAFVSKSLWEPLPRIFLLFQASLRHPIHATSESNMQTNASPWPQRGKGTRRNAVHLGSYVVWCRMERSTIPWISVAEDMRALPGSLWVWKLDMPSAKTSNVNRTFGRGLWLTSRGLPFLLFVCYYLAFKENITSSILMTHRSNAKVCAVGT